MTWAMVYYMAFLASIQYDQMGHINRLLNNRLNIVFHHIYELLGEEMGENGQGICMPPPDGLSPLSLVVVCRRLIYLFLSLNST